MTVVVTTEPASLVAVHDQCAALEAWAEQCSSVAELRDASNKLAAIDEYLARTTTEGRGRVAAAMRRLEVRIGKLLPPAKTHAEAGALRHRPALGRDLSLGIRPETESQFRRMAENEDTVEDVIAGSDDEKPASRRKVMRAIRGDKPAATNTNIGDTRTLPRPVELARVLTRLDEQLNGLAAVARQLDGFDDLDPTLAEELAQSMVPAMTAINRVIRQLRRMGA